MSLGSVLVLVKAIALLDKAECIQVAQHRTWILDIFVLLLLDMRRGCVVGHCESVGCVEAVVWIGGQNFSEMDEASDHRYSSGGSKLYMTS